MVSTTVPLELDTCTRPDLPTCGGLSNAMYSAVSPQMPVCWLYGRKPSGMVSETTVSFAPALVTLPLELLITT